MTTIDSDSMMTWLIPAMMLGLASGSWICRRTRHGLDPNAWPASTTSSLTPRMPSSVSRTPGAIAKTTVATIPGTGPTPNNSNAGMR